MSNKDRTDNIYAKPQMNIANFEFDQQVVNVFPDMIQRSVPGYSTILFMIEQLASQYARDDSRCYDLGCSLGAATLALRHGAGSKRVEIIGIDNSESMINQCKTMLSADDAKAHVHLQLEDIQQTDIANASICVLNFTLQFIPVADRRALLGKIFRGLNPGGILILSEKLHFEDPQHNTMMRDMHHFFKRQNGYTDIEIAQKREAIENVLIPESLQDHKQRLEDIGFSQVNPWFQCFNFCSMIAVK